MPEQRYEVLSEKRGPSPVSQKGFYSDMVCVNYTDHPVVVVDIHNTRHIVMPLTHVAAAEGLIELVYRSTDVPRTDPTQRYSTVEQPIAATRIKILSNELNLGPIYVEELEVVVCSTEQAPAVNHPKATSVYDTAVRHASVMFTQNDNFPALRVFANDPSGSLTTIYAYMFGTIVKVPVTNLINREATITVVITSCGQVVYQKSYTMGEFLNKNKFITERNSPVLCIGMSRFAVEQYAKAHERETDAIPEDTLKSLKAEWSMESSAHHNKQIADLESKLLSAQWESSQYQQQNRLLSYSLSEMKNQNEVLQSQINGYKSVFNCNEQKYSLARETLQTDIVREKTKQARLATDTEQVKQAEVIWKIVGGIVIAVGTALITSYLKEKNK